MKEYQLPISIWPSKQTHTYCIDATSNEEKQRNLHPNHQPPSSIHPSTYIVALTRLLSTYIPTCGSRNPWCYSGENNPNKKRQPHPHPVAKLWSPCIFSLVFLKSPQKHSKRNKVARYPNQCSYPACLLDGWKKKHQMHPIPQAAGSGSGLVVIDHLPGVDGSLSLGREPRQPRQTWDGSCGAQPREGGGAGEAGDGTSHLGEREPEAKGGEMERWCFFGMGILSGKSSQNTISDLCDLCFEWVALHFMGHLQHRGTYHRASKDLASKDISSQANLLKFWSTLIYPKTKRVGKGYQKLTYVWKQCDNIK